MSCFHSRGLISGLSWEFFTRSGRILMSRETENGYGNRSGPVRKYRNALCLGPAAVKQPVRPAREADVHVPFFFAFEFRVANEATGRCLFSHGTHPPKDIYCTKVI